jgi:hypothetical protein
MEKPLQYDNVSSTVLTQEYNKLNDELTKRLGKDSYKLSALLQMERELTLREERG